MQSDGRRQTNLESAFRPEQGVRMTYDGLTGSHVPATGPRTSRARLALPETLSGRPRAGRHLLAPTELRTVQPHPVQDEGQLACESHPCPLDAAALGHLHGPALERRK